MMSLINKDDDSLYNHLDENATNKDDMKRSAKKEHRKSLSTTTLVSSSDVGVADYNEYDVLSGRGSSINTHPGNGYFRHVINEHRRTYLNSKWQKRREIAKFIVDSIRTRGGRFLKQANEDDRNSLWYEIGDKGAIDKTTQALRQMKMRRKLMVEDEKNTKQPLKDAFQCPPDQVGNATPGPTFSQPYSSNHQQPNPFSMSDAANRWFSQHLQQIGSLPILSDPLGGLRQDSNLISRSRNNSVHGDVVPNSQSRNGDQGGEGFEERVTPFRSYGV